MKTRGVGDDARPFRILSLDGGGIRGAFIAGFLARLEEMLTCRIADYFDLIAGTSTGGIIAAALAMHEPASKIEKFYRDRGAKIFARRPPKPLTRLERGIAVFVEKFFLKPYGLDYDHLLQSKYESAELRSALSEVFGDRKLEEAYVRLLIPAVDMTRGQTITFKTPHLPGLDRDRHYKFVDILMATTAAPTYFPHASIEHGSAYIDGGLWVNNPSVAAIAEALRIREVSNREEQDHPIDLETIYLLSVGTGKTSIFAKPPASGAGVLWWGPRLLDASSMSQSQGINFQAHYILGERATRIDFDLPQGNWSLDALEPLDEMIRIGHERANENLVKLRSVFFDEKSRHPFWKYPTTTAAGLGK
jgi:uncharacterized protein